MKHFLLKIFFLTAIVPALFYPVGADNIPERIILNVTEDPSTGVAVTWRTKLWSENPSVQLLEATDGVDRRENDLNSKDYENIFTVPAVSEKVHAKEDIYYFSHSAVLKGLKPGTLYQYRVGYGKTWSEWEHVQTASTGFKPFRFIYLGDPQNDIKSYCSRAFRTAFAAAPETGFVLVAGDLVSRPWIDDSWGELFYAAGWITRRVPFAMVAGNHGYYHENSTEEVDKVQHWLWRPHFTQPENGPEGLEETAYTFVYQDVRFIILNGNERLEDQAVWMEKILKNNTTLWTILSIHHPMYSTGYDRDNPGLRERFLPIIDRYNVDLVLQGHDHTYGRTFKLRNGKIVKDNEPGTVFIVSVSGPKFYPVNEKHRKLMAKIETGKQLYQVLSVEKDHIDYESRTVTGRLFDSFRLKKRK